MLWLWGCGSRGCISLVKANDFKHYCAAACTGTSLRHTCGAPRHLMNRCTKYGALDLFTLECPCHFKNESSNVFISFGHVISRNFFRNFTFEIIYYFKCRSNGSSQPQLNRMLKFSLNRPTASHSYIFIITFTLIIAADWSISLYRTE